MADINISPTHDKSNKSPKKGKKLSTRVDLTPMVDLGFLLITFFMFATTMSQPAAMHLNMPDDNNTVSTNIPQSGAFTIWLGKNNNIYYYQGELKADLSNLAQCNFENIGQILLDKKIKTDSSKLFITVIPGNQSTYKNIIDILNEFTINDIERYAMVNKPDPQFEKDIDVLDSKITN